MQSLHLNDLIERVKGGDVAATTHLKRLLRIVVGTEVRRSLQSESYDTPVGRHVQDLLDEVGPCTAYGASDAATALESTAHRITQTICGQTVARLRSEGRSACDTVLA